MILSYLIPVLRAPFIQPAETETGSARPSSPSTAAASSEASNTTVTITMNHTHLGDGRRLVKQIPPRRFTDNVMKDQLATGL